MRLRTSALLTLLVILAGIAPACLATDFTLANGGFTFHVPNGWPRIMQSPGNPETQVFQVPDPSVTGKSALARVTVTSEKVGDIASFEVFVSEATNHDQALPGFKLDSTRSTATRLYYTATEGQVAQTYVDHFFLHQGFAIQVRCVRPTHSEAGAAWTRQFDQGCASIAASLK